MKPGPRLQRNFFERPCLEVAPDLIGLILVRREASGATLAGRIVEVEAYLGEGQDEASHAHRGPTPRNGAMFGPPGRLYIYRSYGIHLCANLVCEPKGAAAAVLLRAIEPLTGIEQMKRNRGLATNARETLIATGPGRLTQAFNLKHIHNNKSTLKAGPISIHYPRDPIAPHSHVACPRIGITKAKSAPYRFCAPQSDHLSKPIPNTKPATPAKARPKAEPVPPPPKSTS